MGSRTDEMDRSCRHAKVRVDAALREMDRVLVDGGVAILLETMGTATKTPQRDGTLASASPCGWLLAFKGGPRRDAPVRP